MKVTNDIGFEPLFGMVIVEPFEQQNITKGGIILPDVAKGKATKGTVVAVGTGRNKDGRVIKPTVRVGDVVAYSEYGNADITIGEKKYIILDEGQLWGRYK